MIRHTPPPEKPYVVMGCDGTMLFDDAEWPSYATWTCAQNADHREVLYGELRPPAAVKRCSFAGCEGTMTGNEAHWPFAASGSATVRTCTASRLWQSSPALSPTARGPCSGNHDLASGPAARTHSTVSSNHSRRRTGGQVLEKRARFTTPEAAPAQKRQAMPARTGIRTPK